MASSAREPPNARWTRAEEESGECASACSPMSVWTPPTPAGTHRTPPSRAEPLQTLLPSIHSPNRMLIGLAHGTPLMTPANAASTVTPPSCLRRDSLVVPSSIALQKLCKGSGVTVYRMDRTPERGLPRSPWVLKKSNVSPMLARERRRVERCLEHESRMLSQMRHPNVVGFRAAQRLPDGQLCIALESCDCSLYNLIQERQMHHSFSNCDSFERSTATPHPLFEAREVLEVQPPLPPPPPYPRPHPPPPPLPSSRSLTPFT